MDQVYLRCHQRISSLFLTHTSHRTRTVIEHLVLILAVSSFCVVTLSHVQFVARGDRSDCITDIVGYRNDTDVTKVLIVGGSGGGGDELVVLRRRYERSFVVNGDGFVIANDDNDDDETEFSCPVKKKEVSFRDVCGLERRGGEDRSQLISLEWLDANVVYSYSREEGFLLLSSEIQRRHNIISQYIVLSLSDTKCFGEPFLQRLVVSLHLFPTIVLNLILPLEPTYIRDHSTSTTFPGRATPSFPRSSNVVLFKLSIILTSLFLFFITTTLVSFTLRETQERMLKFTLLLQQRIRQRQAYTSLILRHVADMLVFVPITTGVLFFMVQFFKDRVLAFLVLSVVWMCEAFSVIGMRSVASVRFFPQVFYLYFTLFCTYVLSSPNGFRYWSLASTVFFLWHGMLFFWNRYELAIGALRRFPSVSSLGTRRGSFPSSSSFGGLRRANESSENVLFLGGSNDDDESYAIFMDGEVVMHRERQHERSETSQMMPNGQEIDS